MEAIMQHSIIADPCTFDCKTLLLVFTALSKQDGNRGTLCEVCLAIMKTLADVGSYYIKGKKDMPFLDAWT